MYSFSNKTYEPLQFLQYIYTTTMTHFCPFVLEKQLIKIIIQETG